MDVKECLLNHTQERLICFIDLIHGKSGPYSEIFHVLVELS